ncbi:MULTISPECIES: hypothetical protein [Burkholderia]|uniref:Uncharacterized protein n=2 Tax=Burkholderia cepacia complex TaxID=87882 RepID=A0AAP1V864_9BURK|nr:MULTISPECIES: hypothetical protein [Burkholderia]MBK1902227.1 hypothetical protein [Burkholderia contaminans]MBK1910510.1 hypothetical protein [Burkholderia contaminans]MBK1923969.1 hypothetical protein [Burkholderia contaminans]MBK1932181.1 hypothetical protein [Burkholderia contaminans]MBK1939430.1 hypothetical protein [Burkholderia contaminans]
MSTVMDSISTSVARAVASHVLYLDDLLERIATLCNAPNGTRQYPLYREDVSCKRLESALRDIRRCRELIHEFDRRWNVGPHEREVTLSKALVVELQFLDIALDEMAPERLAGYGPVTGDLRGDYVRLVADCKAVVAGMQSGLLMRA